MDREVLRAARALVGWSQMDLATAAGVSLGTIKRLEPGSGPLQAEDLTVEKMRNALQGAGVVFIDHGETSAESGPGVRLALTNELEKLGTVHRRLDDAQDALDGLSMMYAESDIAADMESAMAAMERAKDTIARRMSQIGQEATAHKPAK